MARKIADLVCDAVVAAGSADCLSCGGINTGNRKRPYYLHSDRFDVLNEFFKRILPFSQGH